MMLDKKQILVIFSFEFEMDHEVADKICNINRTFGPETANEHIVQWWFKKFFKEGKSLEDEECSSWSLKVDSDQLRAIIQADPLKTTQEVAEELNVDHSMVLWHLKQSEKVKKLNKWVPCAAAAKSLQLCPTLYNSIHCSPPGSPVPGILQARILEWVAISFSNAWKWKVKVKLLSRVRLLATPWTAAHQAPPSMGYSRKEYWSGLPLPSLNISYRKQFLRIILFVIANQAPRNKSNEICIRSLHWFLQNMQIITTIFYFVPGLYILCYVILTISPWSRDRWGKKVSKIICPRPQHLVSGQALISAQTSAMTVLFLWCHVASCN